VLEKEFKELESELRKENEMKRELEEIPDNT